MRVRRFAFPLLIAAGLAVCPSPARADSTQVFLALFVGPQSYDMSDINGVVREANDDLEGTGFSIEEITSGMGFGAGLRVWPTRKIAVFLDFMRLSAKTSQQGIITGTPVEFKIEVPASAFTATVGYFRSWRRIRYGLGAGGGYYVCDGEIGSNAPGFEANAELHGDGAGFHGLAMADLVISSAFRLEVALGYRAAKTSDLTTNGQVFMLENGSTFDADWTGMTSRFGISLTFDPGPYPE